jgi:phosphoglycerate dehydrogenase-like enzyme
VALRETDRDEARYRAPTAIADRNAFSTRDRSKVCAEMSPELADADGRCWLPHVVTVLDVRVTTSNVLARSARTGYVRHVRVLVHLGDSFAEQIAAACPGVETIVVPTADPVDPELRADALLTLPWGTPNLAALLDSTGVRWVHTVGTGVDRFPLDVVGDRLLTCSRGASAVPIAEWVLAQMLAFEKDLPGVWLRARPTSWNFHPRMGGLHGKALGLVGIGGIGRAVAERALPFGMRVRAFRRTPAASPLPDVEIAASLPDLLASADHLVLVAPATPETRGMIGEDALAAVKPGVHLVNVARGSLVDEDALRRALDDGRIALASLDAVEPEPLPEDHWMYAHPRVHVSAHVSWNGPGGEDVLVGKFVENLRRWRAGETLEGIVDVAAGY